MSLPLFARPTPEPYEPRPTFLEQPASASFDGATYDARLDQARLASQLGRVYRVMADGQWRSLTQLKADIRDTYDVDDSEAAVSARLRDLRKSRFGSYVVNRRRVAGGYYEYQVR